MKKLFTLTVFTALSIAAISQSPQKMSYQSVVRNSSGALVANQAVGMKISILQGSATGTIVFSETYSPNPQTNANGLATVEIGGGTATVGTFSGINWASGPYFLKTETDPAGGTNYTVTGTSQLLSVPYSLYAKTAANGFSGAWADITGKPTLSAVATSGSYNDLLNRPSLFSGSYNDLTNKPVLFDGTWTSLTGKPVLFDGTWTSLTGKPVLFDGTWNSLSGKPAGFADGIDNVDDADNSITNEIQALSLSGTVLTLSSGGGSVTLPSSGGGDNWGTQTVVTDATLAGNGTTATPLRIADNGVSAIKILNSAVTADKLATNAVTTDKINAGAVTGAKIAQAGATTGQALKWNGTTWAPADDATGGGSSGWTDDGTIVRLSTTTDSVQMGSVSRLGKLNVGGNIGLNLLSSIYFGSDATRITGLTGGVLRLVAEDLWMLTTEDITFGHYGDETWIEFDNTNKRVGIGTLTPLDRLHVVQSTATAGLSAIRGVATPTTVSNNGVYGESLSPTGYGIYGKSLKYGVYGTATGNQGRGVVGEATNTASIGVQGIATNTSSTGVWGEGSNQGVYGYSTATTGKGVYGRVTSPSGYSGYFEGGKFLVKGSAEVEDTLYADVVNAGKIITMPGLAHSVVGSPETYHSLATTWAELNSVTINLPAPGYVLLIVSCELLSDHAYNDVTAVYLGISKTSDGTGIKAIAHWRVNILTGSDFIDEVISAQTPLQVTSAGPQTFYLMGYRKGGADTDVVYRHQCNMTALYFPVAYGTVE